MFLFKNFVLVTALVASWSAFGAEKTVTIGQTLGLGNANATEKQRAQRVQHGALAYLESVNRSGGVNGTKIVLKTIDDEGQSAKVKKNMTDLGADPSVLALKGMAGGGACREAMATANEKGLPLLGCMAGSPQLRLASQQVFNIRPGHDAEYKAMAKHFKGLFVRTAFFVHDDNETGKLHLENAKLAMAAQGITLVGNFAVSSKSKPEEAVALLKISNAQALFNQGPNPFLVNVISQSRAAGMLSVQFMSVCSGADSLVSALQETSRGLLFTQVVPFPYGGNSTLSLVKEYQQDLRTLFPNDELSYDSFEAYINARVMVLALQKAGAKPSRSSLSAAIGALGEIDVGGFRLKMTPNATAASSQVDVVMASPGSRQPFLR